MNSLTPSLIAFAVLSLLGLLVACAAWTDIRQHRIPNALVFPGACLGLLLNAVLPEGFGFASSLPGAIGFLNALKGLGLGLAIFLPFYLVRAMGAGDVKLMAMIGAFLGPNGAIESAIVIFITGGILSIMHLLRNRKIGILLQKLQQKFVLAYVKPTIGSLPSAAAAESVARLPFGAAIALGTIVYMIMARNGLLRGIQLLSIT